MNANARSLRDVLLVLGSLVVFLAAWEAFTRFGGLNPVIFVGPVAVGDALWTDLASGVMWKHMRASSIELAWGYALAVVAGIPFGLLLGSNRIVELALAPYLLAMYSTPSQSWWPLLIMWLGLGLESRVVLVFLFSFFVIVLNVAAGVRSVDSTLLRVGKVFGATRSEVFRKVVMPSTLPYIVSGLRLGVGRAIIGVFLAEFSGADAGLGYYIVRSGSAFQIDKVFAGVLWLVVISVLLTQAIAWLENRFTPWRAHA